jgi:hypothetical protein
MKHNIHETPAKLPTETPGAETPNAENLPVADELRDEPLEIVFAEDVKSLVRTETEPHEPADLPVSESLDHKLPAN